MVIVFGLWGCINPIHETNYGYGASNVGFVIIQNPPTYRPNIYSSCHILFRLSCACCLFLALSYLSHAFFCAFNVSTYPNYFYSRPEFYLAYYLEPRALAVYLVF